MANAADQEEIKQVETKQSMAQRTADSDFRWLMNDPRGRRIAWSLMGRWKVFEQTFNTHGGIMNFNEGQRSAGLFLLGEINRLCPHQFAVAAAENAPQPSEEKNDD